VQHCTALTLAKCLIKYENVVRIFQEVAQSLEEDEDDGQWCKRQKEVATEMRRRIPDFQVIVGFLQQRVSDGSTSDPKSSQPKVNATTSVLLGECAQRLLWLYHRCMPSMVAEARFDLGKLLPNFLVTQEKAEGENNEDTISDSPARLHVVRQLHVLRLLKESDQFVWSGKLRAELSLLYCA
jgi:nucleolar pre-ribosomal-associated protein 1